MNDRVTPENSNPQAESKVQVVAKPETAEPDEAIFARYLNQMRKDHYGQTVISYAIKDQQKIKDVGRIIPCGDPNKYEDDRFHDPKLILFDDGQAVVIDVRQTADNNTTPHNKYFRDKYNEIFAANPLDIPDSYRLNEVDFLYDLSPNRCFRVIAATGKAGNEKALQDAIRRSMELFALARKEMMGPNEVIKHVGKLLRGEPPASLKQFG